VTRPDGDGLPWYRHGWPWFIVGLLGLSITGSLATVVLAYRDRDPLVRDDWYKDGVGINRSLERADRARALGLQARLHFEEDGARAVVDLTGSSVEGIDALRLVLSHATRADRDRTVALRRVGPGEYVGTVEALPVGRFHASLEPAAQGTGASGAAAGGWRVIGAFYYAGAATTVHLDAGS